MTWLWSRASGTVVIPEFETMAEGGVSGLVSGTSSAALHHEHQGRDGAAPGTQYSLQLPFNAPSFGRVNTIYLPPLPMVMKDAWLELDIESVGGTATPSFVATQTWAKSIALLYRRNTVYTQSEPEAILDSYFNSKNHMDMVRRLDLQNDVAVATRQTRASGTFTYCISLRKIVDAILAKAGPINAYAAQSWSIDVNMNALNRLIQGGDAVAATGAAIVDMRLMTVGHKEDPANTDRVARALTDGGVSIKFEQSQHRRFTYAAAAQQAIVSLPELQGEMTAFAIIQRVAAGIDSTTPNTVDRYDWQVFNSPNDSLAVGTQADPQTLFGQALSQRTLRLAGSSDSFSGSPLFVDADGASRDTGILFYSLEDAGTLGQREGVFSGVLRIQNDLQFTLGFDTTTTANYLDIVVYLRRQIVVSENGFAVINEE